MFTKLVVGTPRWPMRPPRGQPNTDCVEPLTYGSNILRDPGFELHTTNVTPSSEGQEIPSGSGGAGFGNLGRLFWDQPSEFTPDSYYDDTGWAMQRSVNAPESWMPTISTANPRSGTYHYRAAYGSGDAASNDAVVMPVGLGTCEDTKRWASARCEPGDTVSFGIYVARSATLDTWEAEAYMSFFDDNGDSLDSSTGSTVELTASYQLVEDQAVAPTGTRYVCCAVVAYTSPLAEDPTNLDMDDAVLSLTAA